MIKRIVFAALLIFSTTAYPGISIDPEFQDLYQSFLAEARAHNLNIQPTTITMRFGPTKTDKEPKRQAYCAVGGGYPPLIVVDRAEWDTKSYYEKTVIVYHELGHCLLYRKHRNDDTPGEYNLSIMHDTQLNGDHYSEYERYYLDELFARDYVAVKPPDEWFIPRLKEDQKALNR